jgi:hypothetical protein
VFTLGCSGAQFTNKFVGLNCEPQTPIIEYSQPTAFDTTAAGIFEKSYNLYFCPSRWWFWQPLVRSASRSCLISLSISRAFFAVALWLTLAWIWIPCWFCNYKSRYAEDQRDFMDYVLECLQLQLKIMVLGPVLLACTPLLPFALIREHIFARFFLTFMY